MLLGVNYVIYGCSPARITPGKSLYWSPTLEENFVTVIAQDRVVDNNLTSQLKTKLFVLVGYS